MALPSSGQIDIRQISDEYWKNLLSTGYDLDTLGDLYGVGFGQISMDEFYGKSVTQYRINNYKDPAGNTHTGTLFNLDGTTPSSSPFYWYIYPQFLGWPGGVDITSISISWTIDFGYTPIASESATVEIRNSTTSTGTIYGNVIASRSSSVGGTWSGSTSFSIPAANVGNFNFRFTFSCGAFGGVIFSATSSVKVTSFSVSGANNFGYPSPTEDEFLALLGYYEDGGIPYTWQSSARVN